VDNPGGYRRKVLHNLVIDGIRARKRRPRELELIDSLDSDDPRCGDSAAAAEIRPTSLAALDTLTAQQRAIVVLRYFEDRSQEEVAEILGVSAVIPRFRQTRTPRVDLFFPHNGGIFQ
jgi:RNA polymerase sigma factor (sigma-70 family)